MAEAAAKAEQAERERLAAIKAEQDRKAEPERGNAVLPKLDRAYFTEQLSKAAYDKERLMTLRDRCIASSECSVEVLKVINEGLANTFTEQLSKAAYDKQRLMTLRDRCIASSECSVEVLKVINERLAK